MELKRLNLGFLILAVALMLSLFGCAGSDSQPAHSQLTHALQVNVTGHQWWFEFEYPDAGNGKKIITANEMRIPVDRPIRISLESDDVIHSFWVPKLAGKLDMVPTHVNKMWFQADSDSIDEDLPVTFDGTCAELCGLAHALMRFRVTVMEQDQFDSWAAAYGPPPTVTDKAKKGHQLFATNCTLCHTIDGPDDPAVSARRLTGFLSGGDITPVPAPNLTDLRTRQTLAAGIVDLSESNLRTWLSYPEDIKPGNHMSGRAVLYQNGPASLTNEEIDALIEYMLDLPTYTPWPTITPSPTRTQSPAPSPVPTATGISTLSPTPTPTPTPVPTVTAIHTPTPTRVPPIPTPRHHHGLTPLTPPTTRTLPTLLESFYGSVSVSKQVGPHVHELEWGLINRSQEQVIVLSAEIQTASGALVAHVPQSYINQYWSGGNISPGGQVSSVAAFPGRPTVDEMLTYRWVWKVPTLTQGTILCTFTAPSGQICVPITS
jgi:cytochrome c2